MHASRTTPALLALCLLSAAAAANAGIREPRMHGPSGDGGSTEATTADAGNVSDTASATSAPTATKPAGTPAPKTPPAHAKPVVTTVRGASDDGSAHAPRWHSFLPGMFR